MDELRKLIEEVKALREEASKIKVVGEFQKVKLEQFIIDSDSFNEEALTNIYNDVLELPVRGTEDSMGHDFFLTKDIHLKPGESARICTGIKVKIAAGWGLWLTPRSGLGSKFRLQINNTVGIIDGDYFNNVDNEGHIMATITNDGKEGKDVVLKAGDRFIQGVFLEYGITNHDIPLGKRVGGEGSTRL